MNYDDDDIIYDIVLDGDNTLKQFFDRFYVIPKNLNWTDEELVFFSKYS